MRKIVSVLAYPEFVLTNWDIVRYANKAIRSVYRLSVENKLK